MTMRAARTADCAFCAIVAREAQAHEVLRTPDILAFLPDVPAVLGHTLVVPRTHYRDIWGLDRRTSHLLADATMQVAGAVAAATGAEGMNFIQSNGAVAGQSVFHVHIHVVPRRQGDRMPEMWPADAAWTAGELDAIAAAVRSAMDREAPS